MPSTLAEHNQGTNLAVYLAPLEFAMSVWLTTWGERVSHLQLCSIIATAQVTARNYNCAYNCAPALINTFVFTNCFSSYRFCVLLCWQVLHTELEVLYFFQSTVGQDILTWAVQNGAVMILIIALRKNMSPVYSFESCGICCCLALHSLIYLSSWLTVKCLTPPWSEAVSIFMFSLSCVFYILMIDWS